MNNKLIQQDLKKKAYQKIREKSVGPREDEHIW
jgi:hypothetical protein